MTVLPYAPKCFLLYSKKHISLTVEMSFLQRNMSFILNVCTPYSTHVSTSTGLLDQVYRM